MTATAVERISFTVPEAAHALGIGADLVRKAIANGELRSFKIGNRVLIPRIELERVAGVDVETGPTKAELVREFAEALGADVEFAPTLRAVGES